MSRVAEGTIGRSREVELLIAALDGGAHVVLEGPPGTGKSTLLRTVARSLDVPFHFVEGNAELTPARLVGHFDPARVLSDGYVEEIFVDGPLAAALRDGGLLYVEELNRVPEETLNVLITVMSEAELHVPRLGRIDAAPGFRLVAAMNPFDAVGTARISAAVYDRTCRITMGYQPAGDEVQIVSARAPVAPEAWRVKVVEVTRRTRSHPDVRVGSSVRGAIDMVRVGTSLATARGLPVDDWRVGLDAAFVSLSGRIRLSDSAGRLPEEIVRQLYEQVFGAEPAGAEKPAQDGESPGEAQARRRGRAAVR